MTEELDPKYIAFCEAYLKNWNATKAYMEVYPDSSYESASSNAYRVMGNDGVKEYLKNALAERIMTTPEVLARLADRARDETNPMAQLRALELIGKSQALFLDRTDITTKGEVLSWGEIQKKSEITVVDKPED